jgi:HAD superfamily hydrolase (TIGR01484 family)
MRYLALATDYDGTLASDGKVREETWQAVRRLRDSGRRVVLVTGRDLADLKEVCPPLDRFDRVVAENGAVLYRPATGEEAVLGPPPPPEFVRALRERGVKRFVVNKSIVATVKPNDVPVLEAIRDLGLELQVVFNKDAVMVLPPGINKATGLRAALKELGLSPHNVVGIGDAENDHAFLGVCECSATVANALPMLKQHADIVAEGEEGRGVAELIGELIADDLRGRERSLARHHILLGRRKDGGEARLPPYGTVALVAGPSAAGKSTATTALLERLGESGYQFCVIDPEGDYEGFAGAVVLGDSQRAPSAEEALQLLQRPRQNLIVNLLGFPMADRPLFCAALLARLHELRLHTGRPHWLVFDEAHHLFPADWQPAQSSLPQHPETALLITVHPDQVSPAVLRHVNTVLAVGDAPGETLKAFAKAVGGVGPRNPPPSLPRGEVYVWLRDGGRRPPFVVEVEPGAVEHRRHTRKYAEGLMVPERSFYFRGPAGKLNLRAHNLTLFLELADGVDDDTWLFHLRRGDYSSWFRDEIGDKDLAAEAAAVEADKRSSAAESRARIRKAVERRYTLPEKPALPKVGPAGKA